MANDPRQQEDLSKEALNVHPENRSFAGTQWQGGKQLPYKGPENANMMPGGTEHTAGGKTPDVTLGNAFQDGIKKDDFWKLPSRPCVRDALMTGIVGGFAMGGARFVVRGATVWKACNWAVGSAGVGSIGHYQYCMYRRHAEKEGMMRAVDILNQKEMEKVTRAAQKEKAKEERRRLKDKEQDAQLASMKEARDGTANGGGEGKSWWNVW